MVPATMCSSGRGCRLVAQVKKLEDERLRPTNERTGLLATINMERALRQESESFFAPRRCPNRQPRTTACHVCWRRRIGGAWGRAEKTRGESLSELRGRVTELEKGNASLTKERDD